MILIRPVFQIKRISVAWFYVYLFKAYVVRLCQCAHIDWKMNDHSPMVQAIQTLK